MEDLKVNISRSFTRKCNLGNYESADFWGSYSQEVPASMPMEHRSALSQNLYLQARKDVEKSIKEFLAERKPKKVLEKDNIDHLDSDLPKEYTS